LFGKFLLVPAFELDHHNRQSAANTWMVGVIVPVDEMICVKAHFPFRPDYLGFYT